MPIYKRAEGDAVDRLNALVERFHGGLQGAGVTVDLLFAEASPDTAGTIQPDTHPVKLHGYPCQAVVKVNSYKLRVQGHSDAEIIIDEKNYETLSPDERDALLDHELEHLELKLDKDGGVVRDDLDRPKLRLRKHDHQFGWFDSIYRRHGSASLEAKQYASFQDKHRQLWLPYENDEAAQADCRNRSPSATPEASSGDVGDDAELSADREHVAGIIAGTQSDDVQVEFSSRGRKVKTTARKLSKMAAGKGVSKHGRSSRRAAGGA